MSTLLSKKYQLVNTQSSVHKDRIKGKKSDIINIKKEIDKKLNLFLKDRIFWEVNKDRTTIKRKIYKKIGSQMDDLKYYSESYNIRRYVQNHAKSMKTLIERDIDKIIDIGMKAFK